MITTPEEKPDFQKLGEDDWTSMYSCLHPDFWDAERRGYAQTFAKGCDKIWTEHVIPLQKELKEREEQWISDMRNAFEAGGGGWTFDFDRADNVQITTFEDYIKTVKDK
jgi:hypothetical protein